MQKYRKIRPGWKCSAFDGLYFWYLICAFYMKIKTDEIAGGRGVICGRTNLRFMDGGVCVEGGGGGGAVSSLDP